MQQGPVHYLPIATTVLAAVFATQVLGRWRDKRGTHLLWWGLGIAVYGLGTLTEAWTTLHGWDAGVFRAWYISGALLGGCPLAQGSAYLLLSRRSADRLTMIFGGIILVAAVCVLISPIDSAQVESHRLSGRVLEWQWVRGFSPFINTYSAVMLVGGAVLSAIRYARRGDAPERVAGNALIALGGLLPGIGGGFTRFGHVEVLYVTELIGLILVYAGYLRITHASTSPLLHASRNDPGVHQQGVSG